MRKICSLLSVFALLTAITSNLKAAPLEEVQVFINRPSTTIDLNKSGKLPVPTDTEKGFGLSYSIENFPVIPDIRIEYTHLHTTGSKRLENDLTVLNTTYVKGTEINTKVDGDNIKITFYYQPLDRFNYDFINLEVGANLLFIDYQIKERFEYKGNVSEDEDDISTLIPSIHFKLTLSPIYYLDLYVRGALPISGNKVDKEVEGGVKYFLSPQLYLFGSYSYILNKADDINDCDLKTTSRVISFGAGYMW